MVLELIRKTKVTQNLIEFDLMNPHGLSIKKVSVAPVILEPPALARMCRGAANDEMQQNLPEMYILPWKLLTTKKVAGWPHIGLDWKFPSLKGPIF